MRRLAWAVLGTMFVASELTAPAGAQQPRSTFYSTPLPPPREVLDRLNLQMAWRSYVPVDGRQDGLVTVQLFGPDLFVQTRSGLVALLDAETGVTRWKTRVGRPYVTMYPLAVNSREVYVINSTYLYALDHRDGSPRWDYRLPEGIAAAPVADENMIFVPTQTGRFMAYYLPRPELTAALPGGMTKFYEEASGKDETEQPRKRIPSIKSGARSSTTISYLTPGVRDASTEEEPKGPHPVRVWSDVTSLRLELPVLYTSEHLLLPTPNGIVLAVSKLPTANGQAAELYRFRTDSPIRVPAGYFEEVAYVAAEDANLYALQVSGGQILWRHTTGTALNRKPAVTDQDIYIVAARNGMSRLDRATGQPMWRIPVRGGLAENNAAADRFLAVNPKYVYATDTSGRLLVLDRRRGVTLSGFDTKDFVYPISNETTDRLYLAANNGLIVCLHDREYQKPIRYRKKEEEAQNPVRIKLSEPMDDKGTPEISLKDLLDSWTKRFPPLKFRIAENAFKKAEMDSPAEKNVKVNPVDHKPIGEVLQDVLSRIKDTKCTFDVIGDTVVIIPAAAP
jgi:outer membrane protein assembly factor BamB